MYRAASLVAGGEEKRDCEIGQVRRAMTVKKATREYTTLFDGAGDASQLGHQVSLLSVWVSGRCHGVTLWDQTKLAYALVCLFLPDPSISAAWLRSCSTPPH